MEEQLRSYLELKDLKDSVDAELQAALDALRLAAGKATFQVEGQWYQVRVRKGVWYMCQLKGPPQGRPRKAAVSAAPVAEKES